MGRLTDATGRLSNGRAATIDVTRSAPQAGRQFASVRSARPA